MMTTERAKLRENLGAVKMDPDTRPEKPAIQQKL